jgi:GR25 family glycosyltransferase involved in LPS biosynthesis
MHHKVFLYLVISILLIYFIVSITYFIRDKINFKTNAKLHTKCWVINLKKNVTRLNRFTHFYKESDIATLPLQTFEAIYGKGLDPTKYLSTDAYDTLLLNEKNNYRTKHYQLTRGAIGCYLSHVAIIKKLLDDPDVDYYFIFEDDAAILPSVYDKFSMAIKYAPSDWDMINFSPIMQVVSEESPLFKKFDAFWGTCGYAINKKGAKIFMDEFNRKLITMQVDSKMSYMITHNDFNVYGYKQQTIWHDHAMGTDIQMPLKKIPNINPFIIEDI